MTRRPRLLSFQFAMVFGLGLVGCSPGPDAPPSSTPSQPSPASSAITSPTLTAEQEALFAEAERIFWRQLELNDPWELRGEYTHFPAAELEQLLADPYLQWTKEDYAAVALARTKLAEGASPAINLKRYAGVSKDGSEVALRACIDTRETPTLDEAGNVVGPGSLHYSVLFFRHFDSQLKLFTATSSKVGTCPFA